VPCRALVDRPQHAGADACEWIEFLDRRVRSVRDDGARLPQRAERVRGAPLVRPEAISEIAVGRRVRELHRRGDAELRKPRQIFRR
jgi:hypothetical protein